MAVRYQQKCYRCRKRYVTMTSRQRYAVCYDCQKEDLSKKVKSPKMQKFFAIPEEFYRKNSFLRDIKINYLKFGKLTEKQVNAFKKTVKNMKEEKKQGSGK